MGYVSTIFQYYKNYYTVGRFGNIKVAGIVGSIAYPGNYFLYVYVLHQPYENWVLRLIATLMCLSAALKDYWPAKWKPYELGAFYCLILFCLPFFHVFMTLKNHGGTIMIGDSLMATFFLVLLIDWRNTLVMIVIGAVVGTLLYLLTTPNPSMPLDYLHELPTIALIVIGGSFFKFSEKEVIKRLEEEKSHGAQTAVAVLAHEVRSPLFALRAGLFNVRARLLKTDKESAEFSLIDTLTRRIDDVNSVLNFHLKNLQLSQTGRVNLAIERISTEEVVKDAMETLGIIADDIVIELNIQAGLVLGSHDGVRQILINLIRNGVAAVRSIGGGTVLVSVITDSQAGEFVFSVQDSAGNLSAQQASQIFEPFISFRKDMGIGIGLYASKMICQAMASTLSVQINPGVATIFQFKLARP